MTQNEKKMKKSKIVVSGEVSAEKGKKKVRTNFLVFSCYINNGGSYGCKNKTCASD